MTDEKIAYMAKVIHTRTPIVSATTSPGQRERLRSVRSNRASRTATRRRSAEAIPSRRQRASRNPRMSARARAKGRIAGLRLPSVRILPTRSPPTGSSISMMSSCRVLTTHAARARMSSRPRCSGRIRTSSESFRRRRVPFSPGRWQTWFRFCPAFRARLNAGSLRT